MKRLVLLGLCFTLSLVMVFGSVLSSSSPSVLAVDMGGTMDGGGDDGNNMPPPEDAPATTDTLTAGGGSDNDDDDGDNDDDSGGSLDDGDNDDDNDKVNEPTSEDAPATTDTLTAKKVECPPGQEVTLFSTTCEPAGTDSTQGTTSAATVCPTSHNMLDESSVAYAVWGYSEAETDQHEMQKPLLHTVQGSTTESQPADPTNCPPLGILPFRGDEPRLIDFYAMPVPDPDAVIRIDKTGTGSLMTFADGTIRTSSQETDPLSPRHTIDKTIITPGPGTPLDGLQVERVEQTSLITKEGDRSPEDTKIDIKYKDGRKVNYSRDLHLINFDDDKGNTQGITVNEELGLSFLWKSDGSYTVYPKEGTGNPYTVYPRAADGTQKTVTMTSQGEPILTVRDANNNIIPPKE